MLTGADTLRGLDSAAYARASERVHADMLVIPHFGLPTALEWKLDCSGGRIKVSPK
jgi:hypothetical protein